MKWLVLRLWLWLRGVQIQGGGRIGRNCHIGRRSTLKWGATLTAHTWVGDRCFLGPYSVCLGDPRGLTRRTELGDGVTIGAHASVDPGVFICAGTTIGAYSYVKQDITEPGVYAGVASGLRRLK
jgi:UDP-3-O-[3-hydroxymyristoyl] glucosamine N-acyltransferase